MPSPKAVQPYKKNLKVGLYKSSGTPNIYEILGVLLCFATAIIFAFLCLKFRSHFEFGIKSDSMTVMPPE